MDINNRLRESLQEKGNELIPPSELKMQVMNNFMNRKGKKRKRLLTGLLVITLLIPTSAFAYQSYLADDIYGSFENVKKHIANATMEGYLLLDAKLTQAKGDLGKTEYEEFKSLLHIITDAKLHYADQYGNINYDQLAPEKAEELKQVMMEIQPYFDMLNEQPSSKELLTAQQYKEYIKSLMTYEKAVVQSGTNPKNVNLESIPQNLQAEYQKSLEFIEYVNHLQASSSENKVTSQ